MQRPTRRPYRASERGSLMLVVAVVTLMLGALSISFLQESLAEKASVDLRTSDVAALQICEKGLVQASMEVFSQVDGATDGIGNVAGDYGGGDYEVTAVQNVANPDRWTLTARGTHGLVSRRVEVGLRRRTGGEYVEGLFAKDALTFNGNTQTDAFDSRLGTYASQATQNDGGGSYALGGGHTGSNRHIVLHGSSVRIRGNAIPGPLHSVSMSGSPTVWGDTLPRRSLIDLPDVPQSAFEDALASNNNSELLPAPPGNGANGNGNSGGSNGNSGGNSNGGGGSGVYNPTTMALAAGGQDDVTLSGGVYIFSSVRLTGQAKLIVEGPSVIYVTGDFDVSGGGFVNQSGKPADLRVFVHPYAVIPGQTPTSSNVKIRGGAQASMALYAPAAALSVAGGDDIYGAFVSGTITISGGGRFHYDKALGEINNFGTTIVERLYWRDLDERLR